MHGERMPDDPEVGDQHPPSVSRVSLGVLDTVQSVNQDLSGPHLHLPDKREDEVKILSREN